MDQTEESRASVWANMLNLSRERAPMLLASDRWRDHESAKEKKPLITVTITSTGATGKYSTVFNAFTYLGLPISRHISMRKRMKKVDEEVFECNGEKYIFRKVSE